MTLVQPTVRRRHASAGPVDAAPDSAATGRHAHAPRCRARGGRWRRPVLAALALTGVGLVGTGALAGWSATQTAASGQLQAGTIAVQLLTANGPAFGSGVGGLLPGDFFYRYVDVQNDGSSDDFTGTVKATGELRGSLSVVVERCAAAWTTSGAGCAAPTTIGSGGLGPAAPDAGTVTTTHGTIGTGDAAKQHVRYRFTFAADAPNALQGKADTLEISVTGAGSATPTVPRDRTNG